MISHHKKTYKRLGALRLTAFKPAPIFAATLFAATSLMAQNSGVATPPDAPAGTPPPTTPPPAGDGMIAAPPAVLKAPKPTKHEVSVSGDFTLGSGTVTLPLGYSLSKSLNSSAVPVDAFSVPRDSLYYGATLSYSYGQAWYLDFSYAKGQSSGSQTIDTGSLGSLSSDFSIDDTWYQFYLRYAFPQLRGKRFNAYLRVGVSLINTELQDDATSPALGRYTQTDSTEDILGNFGFGLGYSLYSSRKFRFGLQLDLEGFYGNRSQDTLETLSANVGVTFVPASIDNSIYGVSGRVTARAEYRLGKSGLFKVFGDVGVAGQYTMVDYPDSNSGGQSETVFGVYGKLGIRYAF